MATKTVWYVTPFANPRNYIEGPYTTKLECDRKCLAHTSELNRQRTAERLSMLTTQYYISTPVKVEDK